MNLLTYKIKGLQTIKRAEQTYLILDTLGLDLYGKIHIEFFNNSAHKSYVKSQILKKLGL